MYTGYVKERMWTKRKGQNIAYRRTLSEIRDAPLEKMLNHTKLMLTMRKITFIIPLIILIILISGCIQQEKKSEIQVKIHDQNISGEIKQDQTWSGEIKVTGDIEVKEGITLTILPGTIVKVTAFSDDRHGGTDHPHDPIFPKDPDRIETQSTQIIIRGVLNAT